MSKSVIKVYDPSNPNNHIIPNNPNKVALALCNVLAPFIPAIVLLALCQYRSFSLSHSQHSFPLSHFALAVCIARAAFALAVCIARAVFIPLSHFALAVFIALAAFIPAPTLRSCCVYCAYSIHSRSYTPLALCVLRAQHSFLLLHTRSRSHTPLALCV